MRYAVKMLDLPSAPARMAIRDVLFIKASGDVQIVNARIACAAASYTFDGQAAFEVAEYDHVCLCGPNWSYLADSGGNIEITGEYTVETPGRFFFEHPDESLRGPIWVTRFQLSLDNTAKAALDVADYGKLLALTNGMK
ncbi:MAG: hypothetical protein KKH12_15865, partial [Gammaproteobacteria bacterium]|nr:hypothetical protein [Gammaproteobacteria bacterium]